MLLSIQRALLDAITPALRAVTVDYNKAKNALTIRFFYDGEITDELFELATCACAATEISLPPILSLRNSDVAIRLDYPEEIPIQGRLVYLRKESILTRYKQQRAIELVPDLDSPLIALLLETQEALLGKVTPSLRAVSVGIDEKARKMKFQFIYHGEITNEDFDLANLSVLEASRNFPGFQVDKLIQRLDDPKKMDYEGERVVFSRNEPDYEEKKFRTILEHPDPQKLIHEHAGTGFSTGNVVVPGISGYVETVDFGEKIGWDVNVKTGERTETTWGKIHYSKDGVHIIPTSSPKMFK